MQSYKLVTYQSEKGPRAGVIVDDKLFDAAALTRNERERALLLERAAACSRDAP